MACSFVTCGKGPALCQSGEDGTPNGDPDPHLSFNRTSRARTVGCSGDVISCRQTRQREESNMIDRRMLTTLLAGGAAAPALSPRLSWGQATKNRSVLYASVGGELTLYGMNVEDATLGKRGVVTLPANVQYAWPHPSKQYFYVVSSGSGP